MEQSQNYFEGWAVVDVMGKQRYIGYVKTETYGAAAMFRVDVPDIPAREHMLSAPEYVEARWCPQGTVVHREATQGYTKLIGAASIYMLSPCTENAAMEALQASTRAAIISVDLPVSETKALIESDDPDDTDEDPGYPSYNDEEDI